MQNDLEKEIEALLFALGDPISEKKISTITGGSKKDVSDALASLQRRLESSSGLRLLRTQDRVQLVTARKYGPIMADLFSSRRNEELTRASLEVLAIIGYSGPVSRDEVEQIRGVNSAYIIRSLKMRGLIDSDSKKGKEYFVLSFEALKRLGISTIEELPNWLQIQEEVSRAKQSLLQ